MLTKTTKKNFCHLTIRVDIFIRTLRLWIITIDFIKKSMLKVLFTKMLYSIIN